MLEGSRNLRIGGITIITVLLLASIVGLLLFNILSARIRHLMLGVREYRNSSYQTYPLNAYAKPHGDEIDELGQEVFAMSERIDKQFKALQQSDTTRRELIANVSHDLRTPLTNMQGYLETVLLGQDKLSHDTKNDYINTAYKHSCTLNALVSELLELAKLETADVELSWESFSIVELVQDLLHDNELVARERDIKLLLDSEGHTIVCADIALMHRALENLLQNALRHCDVGGEIRFEIKEDSAGVRIQVADNGNGIPSQEIPHIFERFYQANNERNKNGNGLGLAIVKRIIELHQSDIFVNSKINKGSEFSFRLPIAAPEKAA